MKALLWTVVAIFVLCAALPASAGNGLMGGKGSITVEDEPPADDGMPDTVDGPLNDMMSDQGNLFGDLFALYRFHQTGWGVVQMGGDVDNYPYGNFPGEEDFNYIPDATEDELPLDPPQITDGTVDVDGDGEGDASGVVPGGTGGEPVLSTAYGYAMLEDEDTGDIIGVQLTIEPSGCVQPVASYARWGDISPRTGLSHNRLPLVMSYDATWGRTECEVGKYIDSDRDGSPDYTTEGLVVQEWFIPPGGQWEDPVNGVVTYVDGVHWTDLIQEVHFGRLNLARAPDHVLQAAFDEAISSINSAIDIGIDPAGRLLLYRYVLELDTETGRMVPVVDGDGVEILEEKAIDSPLENLALYVKLMNDGHLVTPAVERDPIDRSTYGGIPIDALMDMTDGPSTALRPTVDLGQLEDFAALGPVATVSYCARVVKDEEDLVPCNF